MKRINVDFAGIKMNTPIIALGLDDFKTWDTQKYNFVKEVLWQQDGKFVGLDHEVPLGNNGISLSEAK